MARRGVFGRLPRAAPDLTASVVALVREAQAQTDQNYVDAWKNGGQVDGKGVDDDRLLRHLKERRDMLSPDDPQWDEWDNRYGQYKFAVDESKINLRYDQEKVSEKQVAAFYTKWANDPTVQKDSEFYRHLLDQAAKFNSAAKAKHAAGGAQAKADAHNKWVQNVLDKGGVQAAAYASNGLLQIAKILQAAPDNADSLDDVYASSEAWGKVLDVIADGKSEDPLIQGQIDATLAQIRGAGEPDFVWSESSLSGLMSKADRGNKALIDHSMNKTERNHWTKQKTDMAYESTRIKQTRASQRVGVATDNFAMELDNCNGDPYCGRMAVKTFRDALLREQPNMLVQQGGLALGQEDVEQAANFISTIGQLNGILEGKTQTVPPAGGDNALIPGSPGYTIFDQIAGYNDTGVLVRLGNDLVDSQTKLDEGGWLENRPKEIPGGGGQIATDGNGNPIFEVFVHAPGEQPPAGMVAVPATTLFTDRSRSMDPKLAARLGEPNAPVAVSPITYVMPRMAQVSVVGPDGVTVPADEVQVMVNGQAGPAPWVELPGVPGPDGEPRTLYRTGNGTNEPFYYHTEPPVAADVRKTAAGLPIVAGVAGVDKNGNPIMTVDATPMVGWVGMARAVMPSGNLQLGTFHTAGAATVAMAINDIFANGPDKNGKTPTQYANDYFSTYLKTLARNPDEAAAAQNDITQLRQTLTLHQTGSVGRSIDDAYGTFNQRTPQQLARQQQMERGPLGGFARFGEEMDRRVALFDEIDKADARIAAALGPGAGGLGAPVSGTDRNLGGGNPWEGLRKGLVTDAARLQQGREDLLNPQISISSIRVPGVPSVMAPTTGPYQFGQAIGAPVGPTALVGGVVPATSAPLARAGIPTGVPGAVAGAGKLPQLQQSQYAAYRGYQAYSPSTPTPINPNTGTVVNAPLPTLKTDIPLAKTKERMGGY